MKPYTSKAKKAIDLAARISKKMNYSYVGTEHILAGLIKEGTGVAAEVLTACNVEYDKLISMIEDLISPGDNIEVMDRDGYSPRTQRVLERASEEADRFECNEIGTEHLLMAIVLQGDCAAARLLNTMGVNPSGDPGGLSLPPHRDHRLPAEALAAQHQAEPHHAVESGPLRPHGPEDDAGGAARSGHRLRRLCVRPGGALRRQNGHQDRPA